MACLAFGCEGKTEPGEKRESSAKTTRTEASWDSGEEASAFRHLQRKYGRPAPDRRRIEHWAREQVKAIRGHLDAFPGTPREFQLYQWLIVNEIDVLRRYDRAEQALDELDGLIRNRSGPDAEAAGSRALRLRVRLYRGWSRPEQEIAALRRVLPGLTGAERRLMAGRLFDLTRLAPGCELPAFTGTNLRGEILSPAFWSGKVLLLDFWDPAHPGCESDFRDRVGAYDAYGKAGLVLVGIPLCRSRPAVKAFVGRVGAVWPQLFDKRRPGNDHPVARRFTPTGRPTVFLVDRKGIIRFRDLRGRALLSRIEELVARPGRSEKTKERKN